MSTSRILFLGPALCIAFCALFSGGEARAVEIKLKRPDVREFVRDRAQLISPEDEEEIKRVADSLLTEHATPIIVVTITSMKNHGGANLRIETFAQLLFDQWQIGHEKIGKQTWNTGILLLVSKEDRKARIELGAGWGREKDSLCEQIMSEQIITRFKAGDFSAGILAGVESLDLLARGKALPRPPTPWWHLPLILGFIGLAIFTAVSLARRGSSGWAWVLWAVVFGFAGYLLYSALTNRGGGGGGFSGGSFGGGFSGGGGATGSW